MDLYGARKGGEPSPSPRELKDVMIAVVPKALTMEDPFDLKAAGAQPKSVPTLEVDILILPVAGGVFYYGATEGKDGNPPSPIRRSVATPTILRSLIFSQQQLVKSWTPFVGKGGVVGQITQNGGRAFLFESPPQGDPAWQVAAELFAKIDLNTFVNPEPVNLEPAAAAPTAAPVATAYQPVAYGPPAVAAPAPVYITPAAPVVAGPARPANIPAEVWATMPPAVQAQVAAAQPAAPAGPNLDIPVAGMEAAWPYMDAAARANAYAAAAAAVASI